MFYHNNFIDSTQHDYVETAGYANVWDDGYPSDRSIDLAATTGVATMEQMQTMMALATLHTSLMHIIQTNTHLWFHM
jgi:hypothetical protein